VELSRLVADACSLRGGAAAATWEGGSRREAFSLTPARVAPASAISLGFGRSADAGKNVSAEQWSGLYEWRHRPILSGQNIYSSYAKSRQC
jgi:hypothetical protein